ncbi:MAG: ATP-binding protein, partial [Kiritimatiellales bacterium]
MLKGTEALWYKLRVRASTISKDDLLNLINRLPGGIYQYSQLPDGSGGRFAYASLGVGMLFGVPADELAHDASKAWKQLTSADQQFLAKTLEESARAGTEFVIPLQFQSSDENNRWIRVHGHPQPGENGETTWYGCMEDITLQYEMQESAARNDALIHSIFDNLEDHFFYKDRQSRVLGGNKAWCNARGVESIDELIGKTDIDLHPAPLGQQLYENEQRQMETREVTRIRERHTTAAGGVIYFESVKCPITDERGEVIGVAGISRDVTRQVLNEKDLIVAREEAEAANKAKSAFLAMMSHEIRTPMNGVIGAASLLLGSSLTAQQEEFVHTIQVSGENLLTIINDILDYSKIEAGKIELEAEPFNLRECIEDAFDLFTHTAAKKNIELLYYVEPEVPKALVGDVTRLRQILVNLLGNAVKFTENGEISLKVHPLPVDANRQKCHLQFSVRDTGIGIADEQKDRLFQAFTQADASSTRKYGGTGLGLSISRRLTELMNGEIWFESREGEGSTFSFTVELPISQETGSRAESLPVESLRGKKAQIVDDKETKRWLLSDQLAQRGMLSEAFSEPQKALAHLKKSRDYDLALIDFQMPGMDGSDLA